MRHGLRPSSSAVSCRLSHWFGPRGEAYDTNENSREIFPNAIEAAVAVEKSAAPACPGE
jgi:hypothetical protein